MTNMETAKIYSDISLVGIIESVMLTTAHEFYHLIEDAVRKKKNNSLEYDSTLSYTTNNSEIENNPVKIILWTQNISRVYIVHTSKSVSSLDSELLLTISENDLTSDHNDISFCFDVKNILRTMMIDHHNIKEIHMEHDESNFVAILVMDVTKHLSKLIILECKNYQKLETFYNDLNLCLLNMEDDVDVKFPAISNHIDNDIDSSNLISYENLDSLQYIVSMELFENNDGRYHQVDRDKTTFKFTRNCHRKIRLTFINTNEQKHNFVFHECEKFTIQLSNGNIIPLTSIVFVFGYDNECSFYLAADWNVNDDDLYHLAESNENKKEPIILSLYLISKLVNNIFLYHLKIDVTYKTILDRLRPSNHQPIALRITLELNKKHDRLLNQSENSINNALNESQESISHVSHLTVKKQLLINMANPVFRNKLANRLALLFDTHSKGFFGNIVSNSIEDDDEVVFTGAYEANYVKIPNTIKKEWVVIFSRWIETEIIPPTTMNLIKTHGIYPEIRNKFWMLQSGAYKRLEDLKPIYNDLKNLESSYEKIISWDVRRTFPSHLMFKNGSGPGQTALYNICKVYSLYDPKVGYCQGMSFIVATILLVANELEAFAITVQIMQKYLQRDIYMENFQLLQLEFFIFERLLHKFCPEVHNHLKNCGIEYHMFMTQWILTMFTAKFPLAMAFPVIDFFLIDGRHALIKVCIALLMISKHDILKMNFDDILKYFRVNLPKLYVSKANCTNLISVAQNLDINSEDVDILIHDYNQQSTDGDTPRDPIQSLKAEKNVLFNRLIRMEIENDILARELIKYQLRLEKQVASFEQIIKDKDNEIQFMLNEIDNCHNLIHKYSTEETFLKEALRNSIKESDNQITKSSKIIEHYKSICSNMEMRLNKVLSKNELYVSELKKHEVECDDCRQLLTSQPNTTNNEDIHDNTLHNSLSAPGKNSLSSETRIRQLENEVIMTKDALAQASNTINELLNEITDLKIDSKTTWFKKLTSNLKK